MLNYPALVTLVQSMPSKNEIFSFRLKATYALNVFFIEGEWGKSCWYAILPNMIFCYIETLVNTVVVKRIRWCLSI